ncbi:hypothetical protein Apa02nite_050050 [Actinoplanes palleronii]|uniref:AlpA family phage regulatory protein n=1 Tax=Actinoplanes palleronii TaxID=113570 RepID=A0ABQ4BE34_9ACTN|nr:hypothetical protein Apa02nite_050050 [Actinoplanes palleronii]
MLAATAFTLSACSGDDDIQAKPETDVNAVVQQHADAVAKVAGQALQNPSLTPHGCTGPVLRQALSSSLSGLGADESFPKPLSTLHSGRVWLTEDIEAWIATHRPDQASIPH